MRRLILLCILSVIFLGLPLQSHAFGGPLIRVRQGASTNWAGYASLTSLTNPKSGVVHDVKGSWTVPTLTCDLTNTYSSAWVGMDGYRNSTVEQTGTESDCVNGLQNNYAWYEMYPKPGYKVPLAIHAGDTMVAEVAYNSSKGQFTLTLQNVTTGGNYATIQRSNKAQRASAEWIVEAPWSGGILPLANFAAMNLTGSLVNGVAVGSSSFVHDRIDMVTSDGLTVKAQTSDLLNPSDFSVTWLHE